MTPVTFTSVYFDNFKALSSFRVQLRDMNVLVGGNNAGKSTVIAAFRVLAGALRGAASHKPEVLSGPKGVTRLGWSVSAEALPISVENVRTDYNDEPSCVTFSLSNGNKLLLWFPVDGGCRLFTETTGAGPRTAADLRKLFPVSVGVVPVLGPVDHEEAWVERPTVTRNLATHRAARNFRNYWYHFPEEFEAFAELVRDTWPGMEVKPPELLVARQLELRMYCSESRIDRELYWVGFGFQIWCQLLTHIVRNRDTTILVLDEPETYLHPDVQRKLVDITRRAGPSVLMATHSSEIIAEAEPDELLLIQKGQRAAHRIGAAAEVQQVLDAVGSVQNLTLTRLARTRRVLFVEGDDFKLLARFARRLGLNTVADSHGFTVVPIGGFGNWERVAHLGWGIAQTLGQPLSLGIVLDRDFRAESDLDLVREKLGAHVGFVHLHERKELENYLLEPGPLARACRTALLARSRGAGEPPVEIAVEPLLLELSDTFRDDLFDQYYARREAALKRTGKDAATILKQLRAEFAGHWETLPGRMALVPGKDLLRALNRRLQADYSISLSHPKIIDAFHLTDVPAEIRALLTGICRFSTSPVAEVRHARGEEA